MCHIFYEVILKCCNSIFLFSLSTAHRRRKSSVDDRNFDSPTQPKRPRVFFTEDQKDSLRQAYAQDPYPNQSTIETLAKSLNVGVKTVINWFHNHRMRAKQQHHAGGDTTIKSEPDESSNQSDISSMSGDVTSAMSGGQFFHAGITPSDVNQWMFPQFEPVALMRKLPSVLEDSGEDNKENNGGLEDDEDEMDEPDGLDSGANNNNNMDKDDIDLAESCSRNNDEDSEQSKMEGDDRREAGQRVAKSGEDISFDNRGCGSATSANSSSSNSVNKRKRSNPQRVYEGAQLDRIHGLDNVAAGNSEDSVDETAELLMDSQRSQSSGNCIDSVDAVVTGKLISQEEVNGITPVRDTSCSPSDTHMCTDTSVNCSTTLINKNEHDDYTMRRIQKIEKIQMAIKSAVEHWDDDEEDDKDKASSSIEKIQKHIETKSSDEDWEF